MKSLIRPLLMMIAILILAVPSAWAQGDPFELTYQVTDQQSSGAMTTLSIEVSLKNTTHNRLGPATVTLLWPPGGEITGEAAFDRIEARKMEKSAGEFTTSDGLFQNVPMESLLWVITYTDSGGQTRQQGIGKP